MSEELKPCPMCGGPAEMDTLRGYRRWSDGSVGNAIAVYCTECTLEISVCRDDVPDIEPEQVAEMWNRRAQPAAPAVCSSCDGTGKISGLPCAWCMQSAAPSVAPEPVAWTLQSELDAAQTTCSAHLWFTNPRNSAWTALFTREQIAAHPPRAPLTPDILLTHRSCYSESEWAVFVGLGALGLGDFRLCFAPVGKCESPNGPVEAGPTVLRWTSPRTGG